MGTGHLKIFKDFEEKENISVVAVCDVFDKRRRKAQDIAKIDDAQVFTRTTGALLENKDIDVVVIATPDHWHSAIAVAAMEAGKHIYVEKPMTHTLEEASSSTMRRSAPSGWVQVGPHGCSDPKWQKAREVVIGASAREASMGTGLLLSKQPQRRVELRHRAGRKRADDRLEGVARQRQKRPFSAERYFRWRKYWDYGTGIIGDLWPHRLHPLMLAMGDKRVSGGGLVCRRNIV